MTNSNTPSDAGGLVELANRIDACVEDAKRGEPVFGNPSFVQLPSPAIVSLANGLSAISVKLRALASEQVQQIGETND